MYSRVCCMYSTNKPGGEIPISSARWPLELSTADDVHVQPPHALSAPLAVRARKRVQDAPAVHAYPGSPQGGSLQRT
jgi:hypothetical protein